MEASIREWVLVLEQMSRGPVTLLTPAPGSTYHGASGPRNVTISEEFAKAVRVLHTVESVTRIRLDHISDQSMHNGQVCLPEVRNATPWMEELSRLFAQLGLPPDAWNFTDGSYKKEHLSMEDHLFHE